MGRAIHRHSLEFKRQGVKLSPLDGVEVQAMPDALDIHSFILSRWRKEMRGNRSELKRLQALELVYALLQQEPELITRGGIPDGNAPWNRSFIFSKPISCRVSGS